MLLDEPFGALDALTRQQMQAWLLDIWQGDSKTIVFVTHDVEEAVFLSDRVYVMSGRPGRVVLRLEVDLPRPRRQEITMSEDFLALKRQLIEPLEEAMQTSRGACPDGPRAPYRCRRRSCPPRSRSSSSASGSSTHRSARSPR